MGISNFAKNLEGPAYVTVGFGVLGFQRAQVCRVAVQKELGRWAGRAQELGQEVGHDLNARTAPVRKAAEDMASEALQHLPEPARDVLGAVGNLVAALPSEARSLAGEAVALGRFVFHAAGAPASRFASRQTT